jgi:hypothetical protein
MQQQLLSLLGALGCVLTLAVHANNQRVFVLTDISNEPDDEQSMVRFPRLCQRV